MSLTFFYTPMTSAARVHWALEELGVPYEKVKVDLAAGDQKKPEYLANNPNGKVPLLVHDGTAIFESLAILIYLAETFGVEKGLYPAPGHARGDALKWMVWSTVSIMEPASRLLRNLSDRTPAEEKSPAAAEAAKKEVYALIAVLDGALEGKDYLLGKDFSFADLAIAAFIPFMGRFGIDASSYKNVSAWTARCTSRPALGRVMAG